MARPASVVNDAIAPGDPLAGEQAAVSAYIEEAFASLSENSYYQDVDLKAIASGRILLGGKPEQSRRFLLAALAQARHWDDQIKQLKTSAANDFERANPHFLPGWMAIWGRRRRAAAVVGALLRRSLPLQDDDLIALLGWCNDSDHLLSSWHPLGALARALERFAASSSPVDGPLREAMHTFAARLRESYHKDARLLATTVEQLCAGDEPRPAEEAAPPPSVLPAPRPAPAGDPAVHRLLKKTLGMASEGPEPATVEVGYDRFPLPEGSPIGPEHERLTVLLEEAQGVRAYYDLKMEKYPAGAALRQADGPTAGKALLAATERSIQMQIGRGGGRDDSRSWTAGYTVGNVVETLLKVPFELDRAGGFDLLLYLSTDRPNLRVGRTHAINTLVGRLEKETPDAPLSEGERYVLWRLRASLIDGPPLGNPSPIVARLTRLIGDGACFYLAPGEAWGDAANADLTGLASPTASKWADLFKHAMSATSSRPSGQWLKTGKALVEAIGGEAVQEAFLRWFPIVARGRTVRTLAQHLGDARGAGDVMNDENATCLRGLLWLVRALPRPEALTHAVAGVSASSYRKVPGIGPRAVKVGNAAVFALSELGTAEAVGQLAVLKVRVKFGTAQKEIEKAFNAAAEALKLPRDRIEEMGVPSYGLEEVGLRREEFGDCRAELAVTGSDAELRWFDAKGKALKSVPAKVKAEHKDDLKELQQALKDVQAMLPAQRDRLDGMFLLQKSWALDDWRPLYLDHPLLGTIARRLIWRVGETPALFLDGTPTDVQGAEVAADGTAVVSLWHPIESSVDEVLAWRRRLEDLGVTQPFKQAHREVYLLTDAERRTNTYSNRYAAHVLRQHQFNALCAARGWKNRLRLMVDDSYPPATRELPGWGLRAEFWVEGIGDDYGTDTNDAGVYLRVATDQVRFYGTAAAANWAHAGGGGYESAAAGPGTGDVNAPLPLEAIPALVFSEIMRDVDLFVGVASVGNDPTWQDGGPEGRYRDYWQSYSFGALSGTASTRKQVLERLVPRLKIAGRCSFSDRFLVVRGDLRTYKIHLGSGNILMEPNDEYLCIVPDSRARSAQGDLFLPFEGDGTLSIILSKALLLAEDAKIKDPTITRQIDRR